MATWSMGWLLPLSANHLIQPLLSWHLVGDALPAHPMSIANMCPGLVAKMRGSLMEVNRTLPDMANAIDVFAPEAQLGHRIVDCWNTVIFYDLETRKEERPAVRPPACEPNEAGAILVDQVVLAFTDKLSVKLHVSSLEGAIGRGQWGFFADHPWRPSQAQVWYTDLSLVI